MAEGLGYLAIAISPLAVGTGLFILLYPFANPAALALPVTALVNAVMALPFALRALVPAMGDVDRDFGRRIARENLGQVSSDPLPSTIVGSDHLPLPIAHIKAIERQDGPSR